ncbi:actin cytoskeleton-regulatory complex protein sla1 [Exaiptasia diaphana]|uniref:SH3 domain-containing protein n=1 Tax=Exaiptasia diaphana TaxID=2652724 RepID=A0A913XSZ7_EXADI|nr:actin cytoskeleton-regulatory complex protein sla1 [Exaiptasia diaphana]KXJ28381.1 Tyrosine-protein kinase Src-1 [Exaiptasia diaphana]
MTSQLYRLSNVNFEKLDWLSTCRFAQESVPSNLFVMEIYEAKYDYNDDTETLLSLKRGDKFYIVDKTSANWWAARRLEDNELGYVPSSYVQFLAIVDPETLEYMESAENKKMDGLCELTAKTQFWPGLGRNHPSYPPEDYITNASPTQQKKLSKPEARTKEQTKLQKDLKFSQQRGIQLGRPELVKTWEKFENKKTAKEKENSSETELATKLKTISKKLEDEENAKKIEEMKPEFMKVSLKKAKPQVAS